MSDLREWPLPRDVKEMFLEGTSKRCVAEWYTKIPFGTRKAVKLVKQASLLDYEAWGLVYELYPEAMGSRLRTVMTQDIIVELREIGAD